MTLYVVATPIGNMEDITLRALRILAEVNIIYAEDTRRTRILLDKHNIKNRMESYHDHNKEKKTPSIIKYLENHVGAIVSDAGTPGISDPGFYLVRECKKHKIPVVPIPGPNAGIAALSASGLPTDRFCFYGFLPKKGKKKVLEEIKERDETAIIYESCYRVKKTVALIREMMPKKDVVVARELTKKFEEFTREKEFKDKGEFVILVGK